MSLDLLKHRKNSLIPIALLTVAFSLLVFNSISGQSRRISPFSRLVGEILSYPQGILTSMTGGTSNIWRRYIYLRGTEAQNEALKIDINSLSLQNQQLREQIVLLEMGIPKPIWEGARQLYAGVIAYPARADMQVVTINRGSTSGVEYGQPVITGQGIVGKIVGGAGGMKVAPTSAQVMLLTDTRCRVDALVYRLNPGLPPDVECPWDPVVWTQTRTRAIVQGDGDGIKLKFVERDADIKEGDFVISSGEGGIFPKGLLIGTVSSIDPTIKGLTLGVKIKPAVNFENLEEVIVVIQK